MSRDVVWSWLKRFRKALAYAIQKIYTLRGLFLIFFVKLRKRVFTWKLNTLKMARIWIPKMVSKKAFLETPREYFLVSLGNVCSSRQVLLPLSLFLMTRAFDRWQLDCDTTSQKIFMAENQTFFVFLEMIQTMIAKCLQNPVSQKCPRFWRKWTIEFWKRGTMWIVI